jgi:hypothetical protein
MRLRKKILLWFVFCVSFSAIKTDRLSAQDRFSDAELDSFEKSVQAGPLAVLQVPKMGERGLLPSPLPRQRETLPKPVFLFGYL